MPMTEKIIDNAGPKYAKSDGWRDFGGGYGGNNFDYQGCENGPGAYAEWTFDDLTPGLYTFRATWVESGNRTDRATFLAVVDGTQAAAVVKDQRVAPAGVAAGGVNFEELFAGVGVPAGATVKVRLQGNVEFGGSMIADAIQATRTGDLPGGGATTLTLAATPIADLGDAVVATVTPDGPATASATITPSGPAALGLSPQTLSWSAESGPKSATFTPTVADALILTMAVASGGLAASGSPTTTEVVASEGSGLTVAQVEAACLAALSQYGAPARGDLVTADELSDDFQAQIDALKAEIAAMQFAVKAGGITSASFAGGAAVPLPATAPAGYGGSSPTTAQIQAACAAAVAATSVSVKAGGISSGSFAPDSAVPLPATPPSGYGGSSVTTAQIQAACSAAIVATPAAVKAGGITSASFAGGAAVPLPATPPAAYAAPDASAIQAACTTALNATPVAIKTNGINTTSFVAGSSVPLPATAPNGYGVTVDSSAVQAAVQNALNATPVAIKAGGITSASFAGGAAVPLPATAPAGYGGSSPTTAQIQAACAAAVAATSVSVKAGGISSGSFAPDSAVPLPATPPSGYGGSSVTTAQIQAACSAAIVATPITVATVKDKTGYALAPSGLDAIVVESGINARQALSPILAASAGVISGAGTGVINIKGGNSATTRITAITDNAGNRTSIQLNLPS